MSELTGDEIKAMIQRRIDMKQKEIKPHKESKGSERPSNRFRSITMCTEFDYRRGRTERNNCWYRPGRR